MVPCIKKNDSILDIPLDMWPTMQPPLVMAADNHLQHICRVSHVMHLQHFYQWVKFIKFCKHDGF